MWTLQESRTRIREGRWYFEGSCEGCSRGCNAGGRRSITGRQIWRPGILPQHQHYYILLNTQQDRTASKDLAQLSVTLFCCYLSIGFPNTQGLWCRQDQTIGLQWSVHRNTMILPSFPQTHTHVPLIFLTAGQRTADGIVSEMMRQANQLVKDRKKGKAPPSSGGSKSKGSAEGAKKPAGGSGGGGSGKAKSGGSAVIELTETNFNALVMESNDQWLVEFYAPWYVDFVII